MNTVVKLNHLKTECRAVNMVKRVCRDCMVPGCGAKYLVKLSNHLADVHGLNSVERRKYLQEAKLQPRVKVVVYKDTNSPNLKMHNGHNDQEIIYQPSLPRQKEFLEDVIYQSSVPRTGQEKYKCNKCNCDSKTLKRKKNTKTVTKRKGNLIKKKLDFFSLK